MKTSSKARPRGATKVFLLEVSPDREHLDRAIAANGVCHPKDCWHRMAIFDLMEKLAPGENHHIRVDAGHVRLNHRGWRYIADVPRHVKLSLMLFDARRFNEVRVRTYKLRFKRTTKIRPISRERQDQVNAARKDRIAAGGNEHRRGYPNLHKRVVGFSMLV